jgi:TPR repeat protein
MVGKETSALIPSLGLQRTIAAIYNPDLLTKEQLISSFVVRIKKFEKLFADIKSAKMQNPEQHIIIVGLRGMGKTTMLLRLSYEVENDPALNNWLVPIVFSEEEYSIAKLAKFWETIAEYLEKKDRDFIGLYDKMDAVYADDDKYEERAFNMLIDNLHQHNKKLLLFIDNFGDVFKKFKKHEKQRLREVLMTCPDLRIVAGSAVALESFFKYDDPWFELFKLERLEGLNKEETESLLLRLGDFLPVHPVKDILLKQPQRVETLRRITGGIPRTIVLLFEIFTDDKDGTAFTDLEKILDHVTPLYKHRMDDLSAQQQQIMDTIALGWDAVSVKEIAQKTRLESKLVSAQLKQLSENNLVDIQGTLTKNHLYLVHDRFFNLWYLMRMARKSDKNRVLWLIRFLEAWCDESEFSDKAKGLMKSMQRGTYNMIGVLNYSSALYYSGKHDLELRYNLVQGAEKYLQTKDSSLHEQVSRSDMSQFGKAFKSVKIRDFNSAIKQLMVLKEKSGQDCLLLSLLFAHVGDEKNALAFYERALELTVEHEDRVKGDIYANYLEKYDLAIAAYEKAMADSDAIACRKLGSLYIIKLKQPEVAKKYFQQAIEMGDLSSWNDLGNLNIVQKEYDEAERCYFNFAEINPARGYYSLGWFYQYHKKDAQKTIEYHEKAIEKEEFKSLILLGDYYKDTIKDYTKAEDYYLQATKEGEVEGFNKLGHLYRWNIKDFVKSEIFYLKATESGYDESWLWLGRLYRFEIKNYTKAENYFRIAIEKGIVEGWDDLGNLYCYNIRDFAKSEEYYLKAIEGGYYESLVTLGDLYRIQLNQNEKAIEAYKEAIENHKYAGWRGIGYVYRYNVKDFGKAEHAFITAHEKGEVQAWDDLGHLYRLNIKDFEKAEKFYLKATKEGYHEAWRSLGLQYCNEVIDFEKAEKYFKTAIENGIIEAWDNLGHLYRHNFKDYAKSEQSYLKATEGGYHQSWRSLGFLYRFDSKNFEKAVRSFKWAIENGVVEGWNDLGDLYRFNIKDFTKAEEYYLKAIEGGYYESWLSLGDLYRIHLEQVENAVEAYHKAIENHKYAGWRGIGYVYKNNIKDFVKAEQAFITAREKGEMQAWDDLGDLYRFNIKDFTKAEEYYLKATEQGYDKSWRSLGLLYRNDIKDFEKAESYFRTAIENGIVEAWNNLGDLYRWDIKDFTKAEEYYLKATEGGYSESWRSLGLLHRFDIKNFDKAESCFRLAIENRIVEAWDDLGHLYRWNFKDFTKSEEYYFKATKEGYHESWLWLGRLYRYELKNFDKAENYFKTAIENGKVEAWRDLGNLYSESELSYFEKADFAYEQAIKNGIIEANNSLAWSYFMRKTNKDEALVYSKKAIELTKSEHSYHTYSCILLWHDKFEEAFDCVKQFIGYEDFLNDEKDWHVFFLMAMAKHQYEPLNALFSSEAYEKYQLKDRFKPMWYALIYYQQDKYPTEYLRMPPELKLTVEEIIAKVEQMRLDYA